MDTRFTGKVAVVTGGSSGIGRAIAERLFHEGASVLIADVNETAGREGAEALGDAGRTLFVCTDVTSGEECRRMAAAAVERWGGIDVLVNSAGIGRGAPLVSMEEADWDAVIDVNLKGTFLASKACLPSLMERRGSIVNLGSLAAFVAVPGMSAYAASKGGVVQLTRALAVEGAPYQVRANALCPIWVDTPMVQNYLDRAPDPAAARKHLVAGVPLGRFGTVDDVAAAAAFLASEEASFITGVALPLDGGALCS